MTCRHAWLYVLDNRSVNDGTDVLACLMCGEVRAERVEQARRGDRKDRVATPLPLPDDVLAWVGEWPRLTPEGAWLPATVRAHDDEEVRLLGRAAAERQRQWTPLQRATEAWWPSEPPPESLPAQLRWFRFAWWVVTEPDDVVARGMETREWVGSIRDQPAGLAFEKARRHEMAEEAARAIDAGGEARRAALVDLAAEGVRVTRYRHYDVWVAWPPPSLLPAVSALPPSPERDAAFSALERADVWMPPDVAAYVDPFHMDVVKGTLSPDVVARMREVARDVGFETVVWWWGTEWRSSAVASWWAAVHRWPRALPHVLDRLPLAAERVYEGRAHCVALARYATPEAVAALRAHLDAYGRDVHAEQPWALGALRVAAPDVAEEYAAAYPEADDAEVAETVRHMCEVAASLAD